MTRSLGFIARCPPALAAALIGVLSFLAVMSPAVLSPRNVDWLRDGADAQMMYLGWAFFRHSPWSLPVGLNPSYGLELGSAILYSDSIPLLALICKLLAPVLPEPFQYFGMWLLASFVLQALFARSLIGLVTQDERIRLLASALFVFAPPFLFRLVGHWALVGQWLVTAALYLVLRPGRERQLAYWLLLLTCCALVHTYLLAMVLMLWASAWMGDAWLRRRRWSALALEALFAPACVVFALWQAGLFTVGSGRGAEGFGFYRMNLNSLVNPDGWSYVLPNLASMPLDYEGFAFLGFGGLLLAGMAVPAAVGLARKGRVPVRLEWMPLAAALGLLTLAALSNRVAFGVHEFVYLVPHVLEAPLGALRASGRLFWPTYYVLLLLVIAAVDRWYPKPLGVFLIALAVAAQAMDTSAGWRRVHQRSRNAAPVQSALRSGLWFQAPAVYKRVRLVPADNKAENWAVFADYAQVHGLATDAAYLARVDRDRFDELRLRTAAMLRQGTFDPETLYVLQGDTARLVPCVIDPGRDQLVFIDRFWVLLPRWKSLFGHAFEGQARLRCPILTAGGPPLAFSAGLNAATMLTYGWRPSEDWGTRTDGARSIIKLRVDGWVSAIELALSAHVPQAASIGVLITLDGRPVGAWNVVSSSEPRWYRVSLPDVGATRPRVYDLELTYAEGERDVPSGGPILGLWSVRAVQ